MGITKSRSRYSPSKRYRHNNKNMEKLFFNGNLIFISNLIRILCEKLINLKQ